jgi:OmpA-OmpF porin, OOP family
MLVSRLTAGIAASGVLFMLAGTGCATKKYVTQRVTPLDQRVSQEEKRSTDQAATIETIETGLSKTRERVTDLDAGLKQNSERTQAASDRANSAAEAATNAQQSATDAKTYAENRSSGLQRSIDNVDNFAQAGTAQVLFAIGRSDLDEAAKAALDKVAQDAAPRKRFIIEVQGYTDSRGSKSLNLALAQQRAESVVRHLTLNSKIPLRRIHLIGVGPDAPVADNKTRDGRRQNRRVEIRLFAPEFELSSTNTPAATPR